MDKTDPSNQQTKVEKNRSALALECFAPFAALSVEVQELADDWRRCRLLLPLLDKNKNPGGGMFGGAIAAMADPIAALACNRVFPGYQLWTRHLAVDFRREGRSDLQLRFDFSPGLEAQIRADLENRHRATPTFEFGIYRTDGEIAAWISNTVAIRSYDFKPN